MTVKDLCLNVRQFFPTISIGFGQKKMSEGKNMEMRHIVPVLDYLVDGEGNSCNVKIARQMKSE